MQHTFMVYIVTQLSLPPSLSYSSGARHCPNDTMPAYGEDSNRGDSITDAWDYVQDTVSTHSDTLHVLCMLYIILPGTIYTFERVFKSAIIDWSYRMRTWTT